MKVQVVKVDKEFDRVMRNLMKVRVSKGLAGLKPKESGFPESTRLLMKTDGFKLSIEEMMTKPKKKQ